jgi:putative SOS response-associated peptidase YedK
MCGRFSLFTQEEMIREAFHLGNTCPLKLKPRYNIAPSQNIPVVRNTGNQEMVFAKWGLVPSWSKEPKTKYSTINARIETVAEKPTYRTSFKRKRCLIPADGFYEWKVINGKKTPHYIHMNGELFAFAGLWDHWEGNGKSFDSCTIIVMPANKVIKPVHDRMPAVIAPAHYDWWLDSRMTEKDEIMQLLDSPLTWKIHPVGTWINKPEHDDESCIQRAK